MNTRVKRTLDGFKLIEKTPQEIKELDDKTPWTYCDIIIPGHIKSVESIDKVNTMYKNGSETEVFGLVKPYTIEEYQNKYSVLGSDSKLYWRE